jgi:hypothetical protein
MTQRLPRNMRIAALTVILMSAARLPLLGQNPYVYVWQPRSEDLSDLTSRPAVILRTLLHFASVEPYVIKEGDNVDFILRKLFLVSASKRNAYELYLQRFYELNPDLRANPILTVGRPIQVPTGPTFGATRIDAEGLGNAYSSVLTRMSRKAFFGPGRELTAPVAELRDKLVESLGHFVLPTNAALVAATSATLADKVRNEGLVPPIDVALHPEEGLPQAQPLRLNVPKGEEALFAALLAPDAVENVLPGVLPVADNINVPCTNVCQHTHEALRIPVGADLTKARLLLVDTGVLPSALPIPANLLYQTGVGDANLHHGTFIYHQLSRSGKGILAPENIFVGQVTRINPTTGKLEFDMRDLLEAMRDFANRMRTSAPVKTWVVNVSAFGENDPLMSSLPPTLLNDSSLLVVAAAGNGGSHTAPGNEAFARMSNGTTNLLIVGALGSQVPLQLASYSNTHPLNVQLLARGDCMCGSPGQLNGTSHAVPVVATAAAAVAASRPTWIPRHVMWRLLTTADRVPEWNEKAVAGPVNLVRALERRIQVTSEQADGSQQVFGDTIEFNPPWSTKVIAAETANGQSPLGTFPILRLYEPITKNGERCFRYLRYTQFDERELCVEPAATITLTTTGADLQTVAAGAITDIILPMPPDRLSGLPRIKRKP